MSDGPIEFRCLRREDCFDTSDPEFTTDVLFSQVFATPNGRTLLALVDMRGADAVTLEEVRVRLARNRLRWETRAPTGQS